MTFKRSNEHGSIDRRSFMSGIVGVGIAGAMLAKGADGGAPGPVLTVPRIVGPVPTSDDDVPYASSNTPGSYTAQLIKQFDYVEEEYFLFGHANIYGPSAIPQGAAASSKGSLGFNSLKPLSRLVQAEMPYATRLLMVRPRSSDRFSGRVHAYPFHNVGTHVTVDRNFLRNGDVSLCVEVCGGTRFGALEVPSGGIAQLHKFNLKRYRELQLAYASPLAWPDLTPGTLSRIAQSLDFGKAGNANDIFVQELFRSYAQAPDIMTQVAHALKGGNPALPFQGKVKTVFSSGSSGSSSVLSAYINFHHDVGLLPDGRQPFDGYLILVGIVPDVRPKGAVLAVLDSEAEVAFGIQTHMPEPADTDHPPFRLYQIPATGHTLSAPLPEIAMAEARSVSASVVPEGIAGLSDTGALPAGMKPYDKVNTPIIWGVWNNMYAWIEKGVPMPVSGRVQRDPKSADGIARDSHGNALGGLRTPWVEVPDATYLARMSPKNPLQAGMRPFDDEQMKSLYRSRARYVHLVNKGVDQLVRDRWIMAADAELMKVRL
jgi:hypothetical protein